MIWMNVAKADVLMPTVATETAGSVTNLYVFLLIMSFISCVILIGGMIYFAVKYRRKEANAKSAYISHNTFLEFLWSFIPLVIFMAMFAWGWYLYHEMREPPKDSLEIHIVAKQWAWESQYKSGAREGNLVVAPVNTNVKLIMSSQDVIHSFYVPSFRMKQDVVPGRYTSLWFNANKLGEFHIFCAEYCGTQHSGMHGIMKIVSREDYDKWLDEESKSASLPPVQLGEKLFSVKGCVACHSTADSSIKVGPSLFHRWGTEETMDDGLKVQVDENYVRESILDSQAKIVKGFPRPSPMPSFQGQLNEHELMSLIEYVKSLK